MNKIKGFLLDISDKKLKLLVRRSDGDVWKVLCVTEDFAPLPGGVATFLHNLCKFSQAKVSVLTTKEKDLRSEEFDAQQNYIVNRIHLPPRLGFLKLFFKAFRLAFTFRPDFVFFGRATSIAIVGNLFKILFGTQFAVLVHSTELNIPLCGGWLSRNMVLSALRAAGIVFVNSRYTGQYVCNLGVSSERICILNPGVDIEEFNHDVDVSDMVQRYGLEGKKVLLTVSRLVSKKNHSAVLRSLPKVLSRIPNTVYLIIGSGDEKANLEHLCEKLGLKESVIFIPYTKGQDLVKMYNLCDLFVMVSKTIKIKNLPGLPEDVESFGMTFLEAGACEKPVLGGRSGGVPDAVIDGETGLLVDPDDVGEIADAIIRLLSDKELACRLGKNGRRRAAENLSWEKVVSRFDNALKSCLMKRKIRV